MAFKPTHSGVIQQLYKYEICISCNILKTAQSMILKLIGMLSCGPQEVQGTGRIYGTFFSTPYLVIVLPWEAST